MNKDDIRGTYPDEINMLSKDYEAGWNNALAHAASQQADQQEGVEKALAADREAALRDVFATAALGAIVANPQAFHAWNVDPTSVAQRAYRYADAMLAERKHKR